MRGSLGIGIDILLTNISQASAAVTSFIIDLITATCTRATTRTVWALPSDGVSGDDPELIQIGVNEPAITGGRYLNPGWSSKDTNGTTLTNSLSVADAATNQLINSDSPATQTTGTLGTGNWTLSVYGTGSAIATGGTATISGAVSATEGNPDTFSVDVGGTVTVTVTGSLDYFQLESGDYATPIIITGGTTATRDADINTVPTPSVLTPQSGAIEMVVDPSDIGQNNKVLFALFQSFSDVTFLNANPTSLTFRKRLSAVNYDSLFVYTHIPGTSFRVQFYWDSVVGSGVRVADADIDINGVSFVTNANTLSAIVASDIDIGNRNGGELFVGEYANNGLPACYASKEAAGW